MSKMISFIIPVYKVEKYINECVDSILNQLTDACEVILVDDGSPDRSGVICDGYADRDSRVKVVHQKNGGLAAARNTGLDCARGEYIAFVDSDDYLDGQCVSKILNWITLGGADICFMRAMKVFPDGKQQLLDDEMNAAELKGSKESAIKYLSNVPNIREALVQNFFVAHCWREITSDSRMIEEYPRIWALFCNVS